MSERKGKIDDKRKKGQGDPNLFYFLRSLTHGLNGWFKGTV